MICVFIEANQSIHRHPLNIYSRMWSAAFSPGRHTEFIDRKLPIYCVHSAMLVHIFVPALWSVLSSGSPLPNIRLIHFSGVRGSKTLGQFTLAVLWLLDIRSTHFSWVLWLPNIILTHFSCSVASQYWSTHFSWVLWLPNIRSTHCSWVLWLPNIRSTHFSCSMASKH